MTNLNERIKQVIDEVENGERDTYVALEPTYLFDFDVIEMYQDDLGVNFVDYLREDA